MCPGGTQGAPIAVTSVDVDAAPRVTRLRIQISNVGGGTVFKSGGDYLSKCSPYHSAGLRYNDVDYVTLSKGYKPGGVNSDYRLTSDAKQYETETLWNLDAGPAIGPSFSFPRGLMFWESIFPKPC